MREPPAARADGFGLPAALDIVLASFPSLEPTITACL